MSNRKRLLLVAVLVGLPTLFLFWRFYWLKWSVEDLIRSEETTHITGPLDDAGYPDYFAALNEQMSRGVTPENNAAVLLLQVFGPTSLPEAFDREEFYRLLKIKALPESERYFEDWFTYGTRVPIDDLQAQGDDQNEDRDNLLYNIDDKISERPWRRDEFPHAARWLDEQGRNLDTIVAASKRPKCFAPAIRQGDPPLRMYALSPLVNAGRSSMMVLLQRAMLRLGEGDLDGAWEDLVACNRLGWLVAQGPMIVDAEIGMAIDDAAFDGHAVFLGTATLDAVRWAAIRQEFDALPAMPSPAEKLDLGQRLAFLDAICVTARHGVVVIDRALYGEREQPDPPSPFAGTVSGLDWNVPLQTMNEWMDRCSAAAQINDRVERIATLTGLQWEAQALVDPTKGNSFLAGLFSQQRASERMGEIFVGICIPSLRVEMAENRFRAFRPLIRTGLALAHYKAENGMYPQRLRELVPRYLEGIPTDPYSERAFRYSPSDDGYRLYSVGMNRKDEGGRSYEEDCDDC